MSTGDNVMPRHPLGLPPGSVRAVLVFQIVAQFWLSVAAQKLPIPLYLYALLSLVLVFFTTSGRHMVTDREETGPLGSPKWLYGLALSFVTVGELAWKGYADKDQLFLYLTPQPEQLVWWPVVLMCLFGGYGVGRLLRTGPWASSMIFQDILAWVSLLAMLGLLGELVLQLLVYPYLRMEITTHLPQQWQAGLTAIVAIYFGARS